MIFILRYLNLILILWSIFLQTLFKGTNVRKNILIVKTATHKYKQYLFHVCHFFQEQIFVDWLPGDTYVSTEELILNSINSVKIQQKIQQKIQIVQWYLFNGTWKSSDEYNLRLKSHETVHLSPQLKNFGFQQVKIVTQLLTVDNSSRWIFCAVVRL